MTMDATLRAYERWANTYPPVAHNPLMRVEERAMNARWPQVAGKRVLDLACGSGRYAHRLGEDGAAQVIAMDFCLPMLAQVRAGARVCADMMRLPLASAVFDAVICGLALGHAPSVDAWMKEIARVLVPGGVLLYSDFHPAAAQAGLTRSFRDQNEESCTVPHQCHEVAAQRTAIAETGLQLEELHEIRVGCELTEPFPKSEQFYERWHGLPLVLVARARKAGG
jgi:malonyl-CoA O-methyltransferase